MVAIYPDDDDPEYSPEGEEEVIAGIGPVNIRQAKDYEEGLDEIIENFKTRLKENKIDALETTIEDVKHMSWQFSSMVTADTQIVLVCIKDTKCSYMRESQQENVSTTDPEDEMPSRPEVLRQLPLDRQYTSMVRDHIISLFDHTGNAQCEASLATANISALAKITDANTLDIVLKAAIRPLIQINVLEKFLNLTTDPKPKSSTDQRRHKILVNLLPNSDSPAIQKEPQNNPTWLLTAVLYIKLKRNFLNEVTQKETEEKFMVCSKQLSKLLSSKWYLGGKDRKPVGGKRRKSLRSSLAIKDPNNDDDGQPSKTTITEKKRRHIVIPKDNSSSDDE